MTITKPQVLSTLYDIGSDLNLWIDVSAPDNQGEQTILIDSWEQLSEIQDRLNERLSYNWVETRKNYKYAHGLKRCIDMMHSPQSHPLNLGKTGGAFATLRTHNGELSTQAILSHDPLFLLPPHVIELDSVPKLDVAFSDSHKLCQECQSLIAIDYDPAPYLADGYTCLPCAREAGHILQQEYLDLWALPRGQSYAMGRDDLEPSKNCEICDTDNTWDIHNFAYELNVMQNREILETKEVCHTCILFHSNDEYPEHVLLDC